MEKPLANRTFHGFGKENVDECTIANISYVLRIGWVKLVNDVFVLLNSPSQE